MQVIEVQQPNAERFLAAALELGTLKSLEA